MDWKSKYGYHFILVVGFSLWFVQPVMAASSGLFQQLLEESKAEMAKKEGKLSIGLELQKRMAVKVLKVFQKDVPFIKDIHFTRMRSGQVHRMLMEVKQGEIPDVDITTTSTEVWPEYERAGLFVRPKYDYQELRKTLPSDWGEVDPRAIDPDGKFIAMTGLIRGLVYNPELVPADKAPKNWDDCIDPMWKGKLLFDPRNKLAALQHDAKTREWFLKWMKGIVANDVVLNRGQTENLQKVAGGEFPIFCGVSYYSAMGLITKGAPIKFVFPDPISFRFGTQIHSVKWSETPATTQLFALWGASKGQEAIEEHSYRTFPWNPKAKIYPQTKGKYVAICDVACLNDFERYNNEFLDILGIPGVR